MTTSTIAPMPKGWRLVREMPDGGTFHYVQKSGHGQAILSSPTRIFGDGREWWHLSLSLVTGGEPKLSLIRQAKEDFLADRYCVMVFPPREHYVSQLGRNPNVWHLWATDDDWPLPEFGSHGSL